MAGRERVRPGLNMRVVKEVKLGGFRKGGNIFGGGKGVGQDDSRGLWTKRAGNAGCYLGEQSNIRDVEFPFQAR